MKLDQLTQVFEALLKETREYHELLDSLPLKESRLMRKRFEFGYLSEDGRPWGGLFPHPDY